MTAVLAHEKCTYTQDSVLTSCEYIASMFSPMLTTYIQLPCLLRAARGVMYCDLVGHSCSDPAPACRRSLLFRVSLDSTPNGFKIAFDLFVFFVLFSVNDNMSLFEKVFDFRSLLSTGGGLLSDLLISGVFLEKIQHLLA